MQLTTSLRWALYYRGLALASFLVGAAVAAVGVWFGLYDVLVALANGRVSDAASASRPIVGGALLLAGLAIWQVGKTAAFYKTLTEATETEMAERFDTQTVKSEILAALDDQLSDLHADVETTRRHVSRLSREDHADAFDVEDGVGGGPAGSASAGDAGAADPTGDRPTDSRNR